MTKPMEVKCEDCNTSVQFKPEQVYMTVEGVSFNEDITYPVVDCPKCEATIAVEPVGYYEYRIKKLQDQMDYDAVKLERAYATIRILEEANEALRRQLRDNSNM